MLVYVVHPCAFVSLCVRRTYTAHSHCHRLVRLHDAFLAYLTLPISVSEWLLGRVYIVHEVYCQVSNSTPEIKQYHPNIFILAAKWISHDTSAHGGKRKPSIAITIIIQVTPLTRRITGRSLYDFLPIQSTKTCASCYLIREIWKSRRTETLPIQPR